MERESTLMHVVVFGGTGFVGRALVPLLREQAHEVSVLTRSRESAARLEDAGVHGCHGSLLEPEQITPPIKTCDVMVLLAAPRIFGRRLGARRLRALKAEVTGIYTNAVDLARRVGCPIIITGGTAFRTSGDEVADESWPIARVGATKVGEEIDPLVERVVAEGTPKLVWLLPGQIYGPGGIFLTMVDWLRRGRFRLLGDGTNCVPRIHVEDCAAAYAAAVAQIGELETGARFIVADDVACTAKEFSYHLADLLGVRRPGRAPSLIVKLLMGKALFQVATMHCRVSNAKIKCELGWAPRYPSYREGLKATVRAIREQGVTR